MVGYRIKSILICIAGQVGAIRLGISRALQNWEPGLRPYLKSVKSQGSICCRHNFVCVLHPADYLTRDPCVVLTTLKKPGKAKASKIFQWVKR
ncbi:hypothetical protein B296_00023621 [Ensete ventricosum]|uniref:Uncharacterized protein n=1 Tax=Ensete ventricosum TaxID=4639 RepID=A0A427APL7_ENSVE|nr:hypothetical protein B296_00023621 [Ensete ventricosum]